MKRTWFVLACAVLATGLGCGTRSFTRMNGGPSGSSGADPKVYDVDCRDTPEAAGATHIAGVGEGAVNKGEPFYASCTYEGKPLPWKVLGVFHAGVTHSGNWAGYRETIIKQAKKEGCPGLAVRTFPPTVGDVYEAVGAICVSQ